MRVVEINPGEFSTFNGGPRWKLSDKTLDNTPLVMALNFRTSEPILINGKNVCRRIHFSPTESIYVGEIFGEVVFI